jgi:hypothetical protein
LTIASATPGTLASAVSTRDAQAAQVMPPTANTTARSRSGEADSAPDARLLLLFPLASSLLEVRALPEEAPSRK